MRTRLLNEAIEFAIEKHAGQLRKGTARPYITHPLEVVQILETMGVDEVLLMAGVLHDTLEDTDATEEEVRALFGEDVAELVCGHTEDKSKSWKERKQHAIEEVQLADFSMKMLVLADKLSNLRDMSRDYREVGEVLWKRFRAPKERQAWYYHGMQEALAVLGEVPQTKEVYQEMCTLIREVFGKITEKNPVVTTTHGQVMGGTLDGVAIFRGIPYGGDCDGAGRFLPPTPVQVWDGVKDCTKNGPYSVQLGTSIVVSHPLGDYFSGGHPERFGAEDEVQSENCLVLNVLSPELPTEEKSVKKPVLVYLHGGGFTTGTGSLALGADKWVREEDMVVVSVNHRLTVFGYLYLGAFDEKYAQSGMVGILDLVQALEWVRDNIAAFGGDPEQVTIMGESGGGMKVSILMAMEKAKGLFHRAIVESGSSVVGRISKVEATEKTLALMETLQIPRDQWQRLLDIPAKELVMATMSGGLMGFGPVADDINLAYNPQEQFVASELSADVPLLVGSSEDELAVFAYEAAADVTWDNIQARLEQGVGGMLALLPMSKEQAEKILAVFQKNNTKKDEADHLYLKMASMKHSLGGGAWYQAMAKAQQAAAPVYHYAINHDMPLPAREGKKLAWHTADLPLQMRIVRYPETEWLSKMMAHAWAAFIRTGNPTTEELAWPAFDPETRQVMVFGDTPEECGAQTDPWKEMREVLEEK